MTTATKKRRAPKKPLDQWVAPPAAKGQRTPKFIDELESQLRTAGIIIRRGEFSDYSYDKMGKRSQSPDEITEWLTIVLKTRDGRKKYEVEFCFSKATEHLESLLLYRKKKKKGYGHGELIALGRPPRRPPQPKKESPPPQPPDSIPGFTYC